MRVPPYQRSRILHDTQKPRKIHYLSVRVSPVHHTTEVEELRTLVQLAPKPVLESLLLQLERLLFPEQIQMCQDSEDVSWHTTCA